MSSGTKGDLIDTKAIEIVKGSPEGITYSDLIHRTYEALPRQNLNTIRGQIWDLDRRYPKEILKPSRGLYLHLSHRDLEIGEVDQKIAKIREEDLYQTFADYLKNELEECTKAVPVGFNKFGLKKWGTPDVVGVLKAGLHDIFPKSIEIVSAEIKIEGEGESLITAFGQACSYRLFSHKSYLLVPRESPKEDLDRVEALCLIFGIGLILFEIVDPENPKFEIRVRASKHEPDPWYTNEITKKEAIKDLFE